MHPRIWTYLERNLATRARTAARLVRRQYPAGRRGGAVARAAMSLLDALALRRRQRRGT
jgi:hypothetical protein